MTTRPSSPNPVSSADSGGGGSPVPSGDADGHGDDFGSDDYEVWLSRWPAHDPGVAVADTDSARMMYTSGTTGVPKAALFSGAAVRATFGTGEVVGIAEDSLALVSMPLFHAAGLNLGVVALAAGAHCVIAADAKPGLLLEAVERHRVTTTIVVPAVLRTLLEAPDTDRYDLSALDTVCYEGSPISPDLLRAWLDRFRCGFLQIYGMTETIAATAPSPEDHLGGAERVLSAGRPLPGVTVRIVHPVTGEDVPKGPSARSGPRRRAACTGTGKGPRRRRRC
ncbi:AMP-binding protein [Streptomyces thinghirensis]|uniref:AMP-binding protein n=1 Tax=Streptomyces thinghirensis TaxID=551547 RepID=UPI0031ECA3F8